MNETHDRVLKHYQKHGLEQNRMILPISINCKIYLELKDK